jgi:hypothetical protein
VGGDDEYGYDLLGADGNDLLSGGGGFGAGDDDGGPGSIRAGAGYLSWDEETAEGDEEIGLGLGLGLGNHEDGSDAVRPRDVAGDRGTAAMGRVGGAMPLDSPAKEVDSGFELLPGGSQRPLAVSLFSGLLRRGRGRQ